MKNQILIVLIIFLQSNVNVYSQLSRYELAESYYNSYQYSQAAKVYSELAEENEKKKNKTFNEDIVRKAAISYYKYRSYKNALRWYEELYNNQRARKEDMYNYLRCLLNLNRKGEVEKILSESLNSEKGLSEVKEKLEREMKLYEELLSDSDLYDVKYLQNINSETNDFSPVYYEDGLIFVTQRMSNSIINVKSGWDGSNYQELVYVKKSKKNEGEYEKQVKALKKSFKSNFHDGPVSFDKEYKIGFVTRNNLNKKESKQLADNYRELNVRLYIVQRDEKGRWGKLEEFPYNSKDYSVGHASYDSENKILYFVSDMPGGYGQTDIWKSEYKEGQWSKPENLGEEVNTNGREMFPYVSKSGKLYFSSDGHNGLGGLDIYVYHENKQKKEVINMGYPLNTNLDDFGIVLDSSETRGYFSSNRNIGNEERMDDNIYELKINDTKYQLEVKTLLVNSEEPLPETRIAIINKNKGQIDEYETDEEGNFRTSIDRKTDYLIKASKKYYKLVKVDSVSTYERQPDNLYYAKLYLDYVYWNLKGYTIDKVDKKLLPNTEITIIDQTTQEEIKIVSNDSGYFSVKLYPNHKYYMKLNKENYNPLEVGYNTDDVTEDVNKEENFELERIVKKGDVFVLRNIYFDYGKYTIKEEGYEELNKLLDFMIKNPTINIELSAHTDSRSSLKFNMELSTNRAKACMNYLVSKGIAKERIKYKGYAWLRPMNRCKRGVECSEEEHAMNRRVEVLILKK